MQPQKKNPNNAVKVSMDLMVMRIRNSWQACKVLVWKFAYLEKVK